MVPEFCKKCGSNRFYVKGKYFRCIPCNREAAKRYNLRKKNEQEFQRKNKVEPKSLKKLLREKPAKEIDFIVANREKQYCPEGHPYDSPEITRVSGQGKYKDRPNRHCRICNRNAQRRRYGIEEDHSYVSAKKISSFLLDMMEDDDLD